MIFCYRKMITETLTPPSHHAHEQSWLRTVLVRTQYEEVEHVRLLTAVGSILSRPFTCKTTAAMLTHKTRRLVHIILPGVNINTWYVGMYNPAPHSRRCSVHLCVHTCV